MPINYFESFMGKDLHTRIGLLLKIMSGGFGIDVGKIGPLKGHLISCYVRLFGVPELGFYLRCLYFVRAIKRLRFESVLDAGCGFGAYSFYLSRKFPCAKIDAYDTDHELIDSNRKLAENLTIKNIDFSQSDLRIRRYFRPSTYDLILSIDTLEHIDDYRLVIKNMVHSLRDGGFLYIHTPSGKTKTYFEFSKSFFSPPSHVREGQTMDDLSRILRENNCIIRECKFTFGKIATLMTEFNRMSLLCLPVAAVMFPVLSFVAMLDGFSSNEWGNCLLVIAQKLRK